MKTQTDKTQEQRNSITPRVASESSNGGTAQLKDNRTSSMSQRKLRSGMDSIDNSNNPIQRKTSPERSVLSGVEGSRRNNTGLPDNLKSGIENLSGYSMDDVEVHYNSSKPAQLQAHAYAQGTDIHLAPGQEKHLPHEAWHVVQQKQGRVKPTRQLKSKVHINDNVGLEREADVMGVKAQNYLSSTKETVQLKSKQSNYGMDIVQRVGFFNRLTDVTDPVNTVMAGEFHNEIDPKEEKEFWERKNNIKISVYYECDGIPFNNNTKAEYPDPPLLRLIYHTTDIIPKVLERFWNYYKENNTFTNRMFKEYVNSLHSIQTFDVKTYINDFAANESPQMNIIKVIEECFNKMIEFIGDNDEKCKRVRGELILNKDENLKETIITSQLTYLGRIKNQILKLKEISEYAEYKNTEPFLCEQRSISMLNVMNNIAENNDAPIIYKVGQTHVNEIENKINIKVSDKLLIVDRKDYKKIYEAESQEKDDISFAGQGE